MWDENNIVKNKFNNRDTKITGNSEVSGRNVRQFCEVDICVFVGIFKILTNRCIHHQN